MPPNNGEEALKTAASRLSFHLPDDARNSIPGREGRRRDGSRFAISSIIAANFPGGSEKSVVPGGVNAGKSVREQQKSSWAFGCKGETYAMDAGWNQ